jgi:hypothetical protein
VIKEMFEASVDGQAYDAERWSAYFRPAGVSAPAGSSELAPAAHVAPATKTAPAAESDFDDDVEVAEKSFAAEPVAAPKSTQKAEDILAMIRARQQK